MVEELKIKANQTSPELLKLKDDLNEMKLSHRRELERAEQKTLTTEERYYIHIFYAYCLLVGQAELLESKVYSVFSVCNCPNHCLKWTF